MGKDLHSDLVMPMAKVKQTDSKTPIRMHFQKQKETMMRWETMMQKVIKMPMGSGKQKDLSWQMQINLQTEKATHLGKGMRMDSNWLIRRLRR